MLQKTLQKKKVVSRIHGDKGGHWEVKKIGQNSGHFNNRRYVCAQLNCHFYYPYLRSCKEVFYIVRQAQNIQGMLRFDALFGNLMLRFDAIRVSKHIMFMLKDN